MSIAMSSRVPISGWQPDYAILLAATYVAEAGYVGHPGKLLMNKSF